MSLQFRRKTLLLLHLETGIDDFVNLEAAIGSAANQQISQMFPCGARKWALSYQIRNLLVLLNFGFLALSPPNNLINQLLLLADMSLCVCQTYRNLKD